jgi:predicted dehydrogenase
MGRRTLRVGIGGCGKIAINHAKALKGIPEVELIASPVVHGRLRERQRTDGHPQARGPYANRGQAVLDDREPAVSGTEARKAPAIIMAIYESARTGSPVAVSQLPAIIS